MAKQAEPGYLADVYRKVAMRYVPLTVLSTAAAIGLATIAVDPQFSGTVAGGVARGVIDGVILGSNAWPSVPVNVQARLVLWSPDCSDQGQCEVSAAPINE